jgi:glycerol-3-phosphate dehydrogenase
MKITATEDGECLLNETLLENHLEIHEHELRTIIYETSKLVPAITTVRLLRAYAGVRPLLPADNKSRRKEPRSFRIIDHGIEHDIDNLITVYGGKLTTYRLMAELTADLVCKKLGINACSTTAKVELAPTGANINIEKISRDLRVSPIVIKRLISKHGTEIANNIVITMRAYQGRRNNTLIDKQTICTCELVLRGEITYVLDKMEKVSADNIFDVLMRRTRLGMGLCQGAFCTYKLASLLGSGDVTEVTARIHRAIIAFLRRRWNGVKPVIRGEQLRQERLLEAIYACAGNYDKLRLL